VKRTEGAKEINKVIFFYILLHISFIMPDISEIPKDKKTMSDKNPPFEDLSEEDQAIWDSFTADLKLNKNKLPEEMESFEALLKSSETPLENTETEATGEKIIEVAPLYSDLNIDRKINSQDPQLDRRTEEKLRKGKISIEARIDLHGMTREIAHEALEKFIIQSSKRNLRHVLVITGKGKSKSTSDEWLSVGKGILKQNAPYWLDGVILKPYILKYLPAQPKDGGSGALYVYLKRKR
jgi:DNA-nicking Smr family endonuclease